MDSDTARPFWEIGQKAKGGVHDAMNAMPKAAKIYLKGEYK